LIDSNDKVPRLYISYPIINSSTGIFKGVVVSGINVYTLGNLLKNQLFPQFNSTIGLLDRNGIILYTNHQEYVEDFIFSNKFNSLLSSLLRPPESITLLNN